MGTYPATGSASASPLWGLPVPSRLAVDLACDERKSKALKPADSLAMHQKQKQKQKQQGVQERLAVSIGKKCVARICERTGNSEKKASASCQVPVNAAVDKAVIDDGDGGIPNKKKAAALGQIDF